MINTHEYHLTQAEIIRAEWRTNSYQTLLGLLQEKGAPIEGKLYLKVEEGYSMSYDSDNLHGDMTILFFKEAE